MTVKSKEALSKCTHNYDMEIDILKIKILGLPKLLRESDGCMING